MDGELQPVNQRKETSLSTLDGEATSMLMDTVRLCRIDWPMKVSTALAKSVVTFLPFVHNNQQARNNQGASNSQAFHLNTAHSVLVDLFESADQLVDIFPVLPINSCVTSTRRKEITC